MGDEPKKMADMNRVVGKFFCLLRNHDWRCHADEHGVVFRCFVCLKETRSLVEAATLNNDLTF